MISESKFLSKALGIDPVLAKEVTSRLSDIGYRLNLPKNVEGLKSRFTDSERTKSCSFVNQLYESYQPITVTSLMPSRVEIMGRIDCSLPEFNGNVVLRSEISLEGTDEVVSETIFLTDIWRIVSTAKYKVGEADCSVMLDYYNADSIKLLKDPMLRVLVAPDDSIYYQKESLNFPMNFSEIIKLYRDFYYDGELLTTYLRPKEKGAKKKDD